MAENSLPIIPSKQTMQRLQAAFQKNIADDGIDARSEASSASVLQISMLETKLENEITKMASVVKDTVSSLQNFISSTLEQFERRFAEIYQKAYLDADRSVYANRNENRNTSLSSRLHQTNSNSDNIGSAIPGKQSV